MLSQNRHYLVQLLFHHRYLSVRRCPTVASSAIVTLSDVFQFSNTRDVPSEEQNFRLHTP
jgi:hypothetical protein